MISKIELEPQELEEDEQDITTFEHSIICANLISELRNFLKGKNLGRVAESSAEYRFLEPPGDRKKRSGCQPDISFVRQEKLPKRFRSYPNTVPDLAIEVESPNDRPYDVEAKVAEYQKAGVSLIWSIHPFSRTVEVYRLNSGLVPQVYGSESALDGETVLPGFRLPISDIFDYPLDLNPEPEN